MKKYLLAGALLVFLSPEGFTQIITSTSTPNGTTVWGVSNWELTSTECSAGMSYVSTYYGHCGATAITTRPATTAYNCHGFAWHMSNPGVAPSIKIWINDPEQRKYMPSADGGDNSYIADTEWPNNKAWYYLGDHSAVIIPQTGGGIIYRSKWGAYPIVLHNATCVPYSSPGSRKYYYRNGYTGSEITAYATPEGNDKMFFVWNINVEKNNIRGYRIYQIAEDNTKTYLSEALVDRMQAERIFKEGESYSYLANATPLEAEYFLEVVYNDGTTESHTFE